MKYALTILLCGILSGCAYTPIAMEFSNEEPALIGEAGGGGFELSNLEGTTCVGSYNLLSNSKHIITDITCSDGRTGKVQVLRTGPSLTNGSGYGVLSDGTKVRVLIGDMVHYRDAQGVWEKVKL
ncbi:hypothetical protein [Shewanella algae]|uniref:hypothetical protein n=1 Tax=Shewanella algae TaxID=38313 RepID=UPI000469702B|nr:hypothetical protein [Shewanella algae]MBO2556557.1 hypothetical protein [Shewanella algae]MBO2573491.1 hypothetical protein [Shewanella algae]NKZ40855.1 hypothetical protein [Shewanella algae]QTE79867.1 hypothetical protein E1N14_009790 [Shewanella algae]